MKIKVVCGACGGDGTVDGWGIPPENVECWACEGVGELVISSIPELDEMMDKVNDIMDKCNDIFEKLNEQE